jgi:hypothetical protein
VCFFHIHAAKTHKEAIKRALEAVINKGKSLLKAQKKFRPASLHYRGVRDKERENKIEALIGRKLVLNVS